MMELVSEHIAEISRLEKDRNPFEFSKEDYFRTLHPEDFQNLNTIAALTKKWEQENSYPLHVIAVGSSLTNKPYTKVNDLDLVILTAPTKTNERQENETILAYERRNFKKLEELARYITDSSNSLTIPEARIDGNPGILPPFKDPEFDNESILAHSGSIQIKAGNGGKPIELLRADDTGTIEEFRKNNKRPFCVVT